MKALRSCIFVFLVTLSAMAQVPGEGVVFTVRGRVVLGEQEIPLTGVEVSTDQGQYVRTDGLGQFQLRARSGDFLIVRGPDFETVRYRIKDDEDVKIVVQEEVLNPGSSRGEPIADHHARLIDSANAYKRNDLNKSLDFITRSIALLEGAGTKRQMRISLETLGEIYQFHGQLDLAISSYRDALGQQSTHLTELKLGKVLILNGDFEESREVLDGLKDSKQLIPYQRVELFEYLGDAYLALNNIEAALPYYNQALTIANKNQISPKIPDINSKIARAYEKSDRTIEAEGYFGNSLRQAAAQTPDRSVQEKEEVADFYNRLNRYPEEIALRKQSLEELKKLPEPKIRLNEDGLKFADSITTQKINYKIANAYIAQSQYAQAIPYLQESIREAGVDDDIIVQKDATRKLSELYRDRGEFDKALSLYQDYVALVDTLYVRKEQELSRVSRLNLDIANKQNRILGLEQERELSRSKYALALTEQELIQQRNRTQRWIIYSLIFGILLTGLAAFLYYRSNRQQKLANNLLALKSLRSQMNPHFIFNALNSVNNYIAQNDERSANRYLSEFSKLMRTVLENSEKDFIPLSEELELLKVYLKLEHARFPDKFEYRLEVASELDMDAFKIPPMLLQPYVENAVWHGLRYKEESGLLEVELGLESPELLKIRIADNGVGRAASAKLKTRNQQKQKSQGMGNIKRRIGILNDMYGDKVSVTVSDLMADGSGTEVILLLKK